MSTQSAANPQQVEEAHAAHNTRFTVEDYSALLRALVTVYETRVLENGSPAFHDSRMLETARKLLEGVVLWYVFLVSNVLASMACRPISSNLQIFLCV